VPETTMGQRLVRAKRKIRDAGVPFRVPPEHLLPERLEAVLAVLYLVFNEGYVGTSAGRLVRGDLCEEAIRLAKLLAVLMPDEPEALSLLALMLFHDSPRFARIAPDGSLILLEGLDDYYLLHAARADLLRRGGRNQEAAASYRRALALATNPVEQAFFERRLAEVG